MELTEELVAHVAELARIHLDGDDREALRGELAAIISHMDVLRELDTEGIEPLSHVLPVRNVMRPDAVTPSLDRDALLRGAPDHTGEAFVVPRAVE